MNTCKTCASWSSEKEDVTGGLWGDICYQRKCINPKVNGVLRHENDGLSDNADWDYGMTVGPDFGCIHHREKS